MTGGRRFSRRIALQAPLGALAVRTFPTETAANAEVVVSAKPAAGARPFDRAGFGTVGVYDIDWLTQPNFTRLLDNLAASPGAFHRVRCFGVFTAGALENLQPTGGGKVWLDPNEPPDFSIPFAALAALVERGLTPFLALGFFPPAVSPSPVAPPRTWERWKTLVRAFFTELAADSRFGPAIKNWRFEVWNEPDEGRFWSGTREEYFALYRATSEAVAEAGAAVSLGGPAIAYKPELTPADGPPWLDAFLGFIASDPSLQCDFISYHRKGTVTDDPPDPRRLFDAAQSTAAQALAIDPARFGGITLINDEADEKVGFEAPYAPRMDERNAAWLAASLAIHQTLTSQAGASGPRFLAAADNADLQLVQAPFDGRRSIMTLAQPGAATDLLKISAYNFYELLRLLDGSSVSVVAGDSMLFPNAGLYHFAVASEHSVSALLSYYPDPNVTNPTSRTLDYALAHLPWPKVNLARFQIDARLSNSYAAAGGSPADPYPVPKPEQLPAIRQAQELALARPIQRNLALTGGAYRETLTLAPFTTLCLWLTPVRSDPPATPRLIETTVEDGNVILRWTTNTEPFFCSYEVFLIRDGVPAERLTPDPLRAALWVDTAPPPGPRAYALRSISASGVASPWIASKEMTIS
jgi:hypothetical protein